MNLNKQHEIAHIRAKIDWLEDRLNYTKEDTLNVD